MSVAMMILTHHPSHRYARNHLCFSQKKKKTSHFAASSIIYALSMRLATVVARERAMRIRLTAAPWGLGLENVTRLPRVSPVTS
jgi:hypothetical protein